MAGRYVATKGVPLGTRYNLNAISSNNTCDTPRYENMPFEVPQGWEWTTIDDICSKIGSGSTPRGSNYAESGIPFFRSQNVYNDGLVYDDIKYISEEVHKSMIGTEVQAKDLLLNITGGSLGRCAIVPNEFNNGNVSQHVCILRTIAVLPEYLHLYIISDYFVSKMILSGSGREGLPKYSLEIMQFPLPPLAEQHRIVTAVDKWLSFIDELEQEKKDLQSTIQLTKSKILDLAIHGKLVPQDPNDEPAIELLRRINPNFESCDKDHNTNKLPKGWTIAKMEDFCQIIMGSSPTGENINTSSEGMEFHQGKLNFTDLFVGLSDTYTTFVTKIAPKNSVLLCVRAPVGFVNLTSRTICIGRGLCALSPRKGINLMFLFYALQTLQSYFENNATGTTFKAIGGDIVKQAVVLVPPYHEQLRIVAKIEELFAVLDKIKESLEA